jgi:SAM-dependent methyltransferase
VGAEHRQAAPTANDAPAIVVDPEWGYRRLAVMPEASAMDRFYESGYRDQIDRQGRAPDVARLLAGGADAERERAWLAATLHADVRDAIEGAVANGAPRRVLDIGAGTGDLVEFLGAAGWEAIGVEPAVAIGAAGRERGLRIEPQTASEFVAAWPAAASPFGAVTLMNVLEHVTDPVGLIRELLLVLAPGGRLVVRVPNDFSPLQEAARKSLDVAPWWIAIPDHVNYFDHASIAGLLERLGLEIVERSTDFPMELFLLMGDDYTTDPAVGRRAHEQRRRLDLALDPEVRRVIARSWFAAGVGRNSFVVGRVP